MERNGIIPYRTTFYHTDSKELVGPNSRFSQMKLSTTGPYAYLLLVVSFWAMIPTISALKPFRQHMIMP
jgi:hypothetical protein